MIKFIKPSCMEMVKELERLCPGTEVLTVTDEEIRLNVPMRWQYASELAGVNVPAGYEILRVDLVYMRETPEFWLENEILLRTQKGENPDFIARNAQGEPVSKDPYT